MNAAKKADGPKIEGARRCNKTDLVVQLRFMGTDIEILAVGNAFLEKKNQPEHLKKRYEQKFDLD